MSEAINEVQERFARFARDEAPGRSARYAEWAAGVADDARIAGVFAPLPSPHRQPPVVFAVTRMLGAPLQSYSAWAEFVWANQERVVAECAVRTTQTNEPLRCVPLLLALERVAGPIALLELGASAGLCLFPDRYSYRFRDDAGRVISLDPDERESAVVLTSDLRGVNAPSRLPNVVWRAGIDVQPRRADEAEDRAWIAGLVWPGEDQRAQRVNAALDVAAASPPLLVAGDAADGHALAALAAQAPKDATLVISTPGVLPHIPRVARERLIDAIRGMDARWITLDSPRLHDAWSTPIADGAEGFALAVDGEVIALSDPLGGWIARLP
ncbi:DUF2332 family protein [Microbacterium amylolyticum]|uniref:DUF2332 domain-containing protein n=1 Tax=Microbacterium amylolyticum TaxID=936337 RepID=A0ABS4ZIW2_9MICO|nr:DUF2332 family protein [Microbacterium amylolyticum]MBP2437217.1 hypothetical protein [Microbacterium amylolyticum]